MSVSLKKTSAKGHRLTHLLHFFIDAFVIMFLFFCLDSWVISTQ